MRTGVASTALGKRKAPGQDAPLILHLTTSIATVPAGQKDTSSGLSSQQASTSKGLPIIINGVLVEHTKKRYCCTFEGCEKAYTKPSRLEEHERSHTGQRPFVCETCGNSYLRETHLHAHARSHLPASARPLPCERENCGKRFWTTQHLHTHLSWHDGVKPYECTAEDCHEAFAKHYQLRAHLCREHAPPGTKPYCCENEGCSKSFDTNQHLKTHQKTHDSKRYTCVHSTCLENMSDSPPYFATWSALQSHIRKSHPPTCLHTSCNGRTFANHGNLRVHLKLHEQRELDHALDPDFDNESRQPAKKKRRGGEYGRDSKCEIAGCGKDFKSEKALETHIRVTHLGSRDFVCEHENCAQSFGYKHLLQRHQSKVHHSGSSLTMNPQEESSENEAQDTDTTFDIDTITGNAYAKRAEAKIQNATALRCPFPCLEDLTGDSNRTVPSPTHLSPCDYVFNRSYDLRRHLKASHEVVVIKDVTDGWVKRQKEMLHSVVAGP
ncbi:hypothetical protein HYPSUDRAFT_130794 [Hypholoma sublateritium FD-334 SS-4]|uniref:C2H2-type domain-containing protein n=1 Tax=Hypholoma sublateritium (strain FD-334 SS-4) TaxID=945553 RepID=A0A0D2Q7Q0_HYPSF|nr:hypothetical protein HYPSUDRAFT_130794 [Hypholoma sublateritium FD-334 SS-4]